MCGIFGWQLRDGVELTPYQSTILALTLGEEMQSRGTDSHGGLLWLPNHDTPIIFKALGKVVEHGPNGMLERATAARTAMMHTRAATVGAISVQNSHPFECGDVIGVHNGSVYNHRELNERYVRGFDVDSTHIFAHIDEGLDITELDMSGTIVYTRRSDNFNRLWYARSDHGSFEIARIFERGAVENDKYLMTIFASTQWAIRKAAERLGYEHRFINVPSEHLFQIEGGTPWDPDVSFPLRTVPETRTVRTMGLGWGTNGTHGNNSSTTPNSSVVPFRRTTKDVSDVTDADIAKLIYARPIVSNIQSKNGLTTNYLGNTRQEVLCPSCRDWLSLHSWGICLAEGCTHDSTVCLNGLALCNDCGCAMVEGVHVPNTLEANGQIWCKTCGQTCKDVKKPPSKKDRRNKRKEVKTIRQALIESAGDDITAAELIEAIEGTEDELLISEEEQDEQDIVERMMMSGLVVPVLLLDKISDGAPKCKHCNASLLFPLSVKTGWCTECRRKAGGFRVSVGKCTECKQTRLYSEESIVTGLCAICRYPNIHTKDDRPTGETLSEFTDRRVREHLDSQVIDLETGLDN